MTTHSPMTLQDTRALLTDLRALVDANMAQVQATRFDISWKADGSPVTASDVFLENLIKAFLQKRLPGLAFWGEESFEPGMRADAAPFQAVLDPIDGTENFCSGLKEWGISFSLWSGAQHLGSMLYLPELGEHLMSGDTITSLRSRIRGFSSSVNPDILQAMADHPENRMMGCAVYNMFNVIRGAFARFTNPKGAHSWDLLAGLMLAREHGCEVSVEGSPYAGKFLEPGPKYRVDIRHRYDLHPGQGTLG